MKANDRQPWPWVLFAIPMAAVVFGILMLVVANYNPDDLVADDYYKDGMGINQRLDQDRQAQQLGVRARLLSLQGERLSMQIDAASDSAVSLSLRHVTDRELDRQVLMYRRESGVYMARDAALKVLSERGVWYLELRGVEGSWRLKARVVTPITELELDAS